ncbi:flagellin N-terminal helical domain-containing protein [Paenibacillus sp. MMS18-CY102]|uniref:flagellin N-terminal helical domain-containing protein n=1 Tax=Paenibacillus sp. MMS18-CY102 TaxID=2682849 RepID=UPI001365DE6A|nr:flagellin [Paenibacillus sp. MMS18-CY102]MWC30915.1 flagellin [Paenibacillus sp. MMS18-CY102]
MIINHNLNAMNAHRNLVTNNIQQGKSSEKLSSGYRVNRAADDAAGLSISEKMRAQIKSLNQGMRNAQDGVSLVQTAEGAMGEVSDMLTRIKELAVQSNNGTYNASDLAAMDSEYVSLKGAIDSIATSTKFNGITLLDGSIAAPITIQIGGGTSESVLLNLNTAGVYNIQSGAGGLGLTSANVKAVLTLVDGAIGKVNTARSNLGAYQNQLEHTYNNLGATAENLQAAESRIRDTDMADEMMSYTKFNILQQASTAMLAQANQAPQGVLQLLR